MATPPSTPQTLRQQSVADFQVAPPLTPRSSHANEIRARLQVPRSTTLTISHFASLVTDLTASDSSERTLFSPSSQHQTE